MYDDEPLPEVSAHEVPDDAYLLDVRELDEWAVGHAPGATHLPMSHLPARLDQVPTDRDVVVVCRVGNRSAHVVAYLRAQGWDRVSNLAGGMMSWAAIGRPMVSDDGSPAWVA
ncbi:MAG TPA: rhodanese-like domain-containing protein [Micromonosporaceae bacterium]